MGLFLFQDVLLLISTLKLKPRMFFGSFCPAILQLFRLPKALNNTVLFNILIVLQALVACRKPH